MRESIVLAALILLLSSLAVADEAAETGPGASGEEQITQTINLQPGWNSVSFKVSGLTFSEDIKPQCSFRWYNEDLDNDGVSTEDISEDNRYHVWTQKGGSWSHPDQLQVSRGYSFNVGSECEIEVSGTRERIDDFELEDGWNLVNVPSGLALGQIKNECKLRWYNEDLDDGASPEDISDDDRHYFWVNDGDSWRDPHKEDDHRGDDGVYINSDGSCEINSWPYDGEESNNDNSESDSDSSSGDNNAGDVNRDFNYERAEIRWEGLSDSQLGALAGVPRGMVRKNALVGESLESPAKVSDIVRLVREDAIDVFSWQYGAKTCAEYNPEDCSASGNTFYVSSSEGWVLDPGTPAPHCYSDGYVPPAYGEFSDKVEENVPRVETSYSDTDDNQECPGWLDEELERVDEITLGNENRFRWSVREEPSRPVVGNSYEVNYKVTDNQDRLSGSKIKVEFKHEDAESWVSSGFRTCKKESNGGDPGYCFTSVNGDKRKFVPQEEGRNLIRATVTSEDGRTVQNQWEYYVTSQPYGYR